MRGQESVEGAQVREWGPGTRARAAPTVSVTAGKTLWAALS